MRLGWLWLLLLLMGCSLSAQQETRLREVAQTSQALREMGDRKAPQLTLPIEKYPHDVHRYSLVCMTWDWDVDSPYPGAVRHDLFLYDDTTTTRLEQVESAFGGRVRCRINEQGTVGYFTSDGHYVGTMEPVITASVSRDLASDQEYFSEFTRLLMASAIGFICGLLVMKGITR